MSGRAPAPARSCLQPQSAGISSNPAPRAARGLLEADAANAWSCGGEPAPATRDGASARSRARSPSGRRGANPAGPFRRDPQWRDDGATPGVGRIAAEGGSQGADRDDPGAAQAAA
jgi:hypothetical protein